jgi:hypothetical protein
LRQLALLLSQSIPYHQHYALPRVDSTRTSLCNWLIYGQDFIETGYDVQLRMSVKRPVSAAAAAICGDSKWVRPR